jgi:hypothetical protein
VKLAHCLIAVVALGLLATDAAARTRGPASTADSGHGSKSPRDGQKSGESGGSVKNSIGGADTNAGTSAVDKGSKNASGPVENGPMKKGDSLPGKSGPQNSGKASAGDGGKNQPGVTHPAANNGVVEHATDPIRTDNVIVDHSARNSRKPVVDATKKIITTNRPAVGNSNQQPSGLAAIGGGQRNAVGLAVRNDGDSKSGPDGKAVLPGPEVPKTNAIAPTTNIGHPGSNPNAIEGAPKINAGLSGTLISRPGSGPSTIGGPVKNLAAINGTSLRPKRGR